MKTTIDKAITTYRILTADTFRLTKTESKTKFAIIRAIGHLRPIAEAHDTFLRDAAQRLRPEGHDEIIAKIQAQQPLTPEQQSAFNRYSAELSECLRPELERETDIPLTLLTEAELGTVLDSNPDLPPTVMELLVSLLLNPEPTTQND